MIGSQGQRAEWLEDEVGQLKVAREMGEMKSQLVDTEGSRMQGERCTEQADELGVCEGYYDAFGVRRQTPAATRAAIRESMSRAGPLPSAAGAEPRLLLAEEGHSLSLPRPGRLRLEDGTEIAVEDAVPPELPIGYHELWLLGDTPERGPVRLIVHPPSCVLPPWRRGWGWTAQLPTVRSRRSWGMGDFADLRALAIWSRGLGADLLALNPLHAVAPVEPQQPSPYFPGTRRFRNPLYLAIEEVPGADRAGLELEQLANAGRALTGRSRLIDRDAVFRLKSAALELLWKRFSGDPSFDRYCEEQGTGLAEFASYCAIAEIHGAQWQKWDVGLRRPSNAAVLRFAEERADRVRFHSWLQWLVDEQLGRACSELPLVQDLAIGVDPSGVDAWVWQDVIASEVSVGAPPDIYNSRGQDWGLPPFIPHRLREGGYGPLAETLRAALRNAAGLRIDHVMGLFRLFWIPRGMPPAEGTYVYFPAEELLAVVSIESRRAGAFVIGEDLGTVEDGVREQLASRAVLSYRLLWFEEGPPTEYPELALAAVTTHDLPTIAGLWSGSDLQAQQQLGLEPTVEGAEQIRSRLRELTGLAADAPAPEVIARTHNALAGAPSLIISATLEDALQVEERPNMPGTISEWPNWSLALPRSLEELGALPLLRMIAEALGSRVPAGRG